MASAHRVPPENPELSAPSEEFLRLIPHDYARRHLLLSLGCLEGREALAVSGQTSSTAVFNTSVRLSRPVVTSLAAAEIIASAIDRAYEQARTASDSSQQRPIAGAIDLPAQFVEGSSDVEADLAQAVREAESDLLNLDGKAPSVRLVDLILFEALQRDASDVHVQPVRDKTLVRYRLDGALRTVRELPGSLAASVVSRIKVMARLDVAEHRAPQDGRAAVTIGGSGGSRGARRIDLRVSTLPSTYGERVVLRLLDPARSAYLLNFATLGMPPELEARYLSQVSRTTGIVLSTGPTGSGKTTTLYTTLSWISAVNSAATNTQHAGRGCELNMMTIEDPVEYDLSSSGLSISQTQVDPKKNVTFATGLRHILRQDPDVIMVGEIRDEETARIAVQASLTGHLVLSTLHTNDAPSAVVRLIDLGVEPFLVASSLAAVLAQRLVRKLHPDCRGEGCEHCLGTGYRGRTGVFELLVMDAALRDLVVKRASAMEIKSVVQQSGMVCLREAGGDLVRAGLTTAAEVARVIETLGDLET
ncbi:MAG TPA: GspE/PulE family protein [Phycisphaerales bacterium]|nr:GspE/PulE family protein [Phycisphaerales bacterium]